MKEKAADSWVSCSGAVRASPCVPGRRPQRERPETTLSYRHAGPRQLCAPQRSVSRSAGQRPSAPAGAPCRSPSLLHLHIPAWQGAHRQTQMSGARAGACGRGREAAAVRYRSRALGSFAWTFLVTASSPAHRGGCETYVLGWSCVPIRPQATHPAAGYPPPPCAQTELVVLPVSVAALSTAQAASAIVPWVLHYRG